MKRKEEADDCCECQQGKNPLWLERRQTLHTYTDPKTVYSRKGRRKEEIA